MLSKAVPTASEARDRSPYTNFHQSQNAADGNHGVFHMTLATVDGGYSAHKLARDWRYAPRAVITAYSRSIVCAWGHEQVAVQT